MRILIGVLDLDLGPLTGVIPRSFSWGGGPHEGISRSSAVEVGRNTRQHPLLPTRFRV